MNISTLKKFIQKRLYEGPTWAALTVLVTSFGLSLSPTQVIAITSLIIILLPNKFDELKEKEK